MSTKSKLIKLSTLINNYIESNGQLLICISGLSGAGKTYHAKILAKQLGLIHIDQDSFYKSSSEMPYFVYSNGIKKRNWDCKQSLRINYMNSTINEHIQSGIIFSGFACRDHWFENKIDIQIHLNISQETCYIRRQEQCKDEEQLGQLIVNELVYPYYLKTLRKSNINKIIDANEKSTETLELIVNHLLEFFETNSK